MRIKLCGLTCEEDVRAANAAKPDYAGFVVDVPSSSRNVSSDALPRLTTAIDASIVTVGVFVNAPVTLVARLLNDCVIDCAQLHGTEDKDYLAALRLLTDKPLIQAFRVRCEADVRRACSSAADMILLDSGTGSGKTFDWSLTRVCTRPFMLAGGLAPGNLTRAIEQVRPFAVDMSSGIETNGRKDPQKMRAAVEEVRAAAAATAR